MAKRKTKEKVDPDVKLVCRNRRATHEYHVESTLEAGLVLMGSEVKSLRLGMADLVDSYAAVKNGELYLVSAHIAPYDKASRFGHAPRRDRKLLVQRQIIRKLAVKVQERGYTLVPLKLYFRRGWAKVELGVARGRKLYDNREAIRRDVERREMRES